MGDVLHDFVITDTRGGERTPATGRCRDSVAEPTPLGVRDYPGGGTFTGACRVQELFRNTGNSECLP
jgi:hypothetical protein